VLIDHRQIDRCQIDHCQKDQRQKGQDENLTSKATDKSVRPTRSNSASRPEELAERPPKFEALWKTGTELGPTPASAPSLLGVQPMVFLY
ncbi:MAG: hypothetical protein WBQ08_20970, partial [Candidatus Sulfotelmatobacter sp.]